MRDYKWLHEYCLNRFGSSAALEAQLPVPRTPEQPLGDGGEQHGKQADGQQALQKPLMATSTPCLHWRTT